MFNHIAIQSHFRSKSIQRTRYVYMIWLFSQEDAFKQCLCFTEIVNEKKKRIKEKKEIDRFMVKMKSQGHVFSNILIH